MIKIFVYIAGDPLFSPDWYINIHRGCLPLNAVIYICRKNGHWRRGGVSPLMLSNFQSCSPYRLCCWPAFIRCSSYSFNIREFWKCSAIFQIGCKSVCLVTVDSYNEEKKISASAMFFKPFTAPCKYIHNNDFTEKGLLSEKWVL